MPPKRARSPIPVASGDLVALVTGGAQGIGRGIVKHLLAQEDDGHTWKVLSVDSDAKGITDAKKVFASEVKAGRLHFVKGDVGDEKTGPMCVEECVKLFGSLDLLVNNAGGGGLGVPLLERTPEQFMSVVRSNLFSTYFFSQAAAPELIKSRGVIVNMASTRAFMSEPNSEPYAAAKGGVVGVTHALAASLSGKVTVNCICPGWIDVSGPAFGPGRKQMKLSKKDHEQHLSGRVGTAEDIAEAVVYLAKAKFVTGQVLTVDGGMTKKMIYEE